MVGEALKAVQQKVKREDLFVVSKLWMWDVEDAEKACRLSLKQLGLEYLDLYLVHWPIAIKPQNSASDPPDTWVKIKMPMYKIWAQMEALVDLGLVKSIGVSNFNV